MTTDSPATAAERVVEKYNSPTGTLLNRVWGGHLHLGLFETPDEPLIDAQLRANRRMAAGAALRPGAEVLEVACGVGGAARFLARDFGVKVLATNVAEAQLAEAAAITEREGPAGFIEFALADFHDLPYPDDRFDCWWCQEALLYSTDKERVLSEALRVVKPGGRLILSDLLLGRGMTGEARRHYVSTLSAQGMWPIEKWDALLAEMGVRIVEREDWSRHTELTCQRVLEALYAAREHFSDTVGREAVEGTIHRMTMQLEAARAGHLGWCYYAIEV